MAAVAGPITVDVSDKRHWFVLYTDLLILMQMRALASHHLSTAARNRLGERKSRVHCFGSALRCFLSACIASL